MKRLLFLLSLGAALSPAATIEIPSCASLETFQDLINAGQCTSGIFTVKNPTVNFLPEGVSASDILINVSAVSDNVNFSLSSAAFTSSPFGGFQSFSLGYTFDPPPDIIKGVSGAIEDSGQESGDFDLLLDLDGNAIAADASDAVFVQYSLCAGAAFSGQECIGDLYGFSLNRPSSDILPRGDLAFDPMLINGVIFRSPVNTVGVVLLIELRDGGFLGPLTTGFPIATDVPEPGTLGMAGLAGVAIVWARRRRA
ncbi:MAG: PEP-CTERM sorting domain-containing protein [Bryobacterales bacterium]|nr:PEP-CTERM sorting domain-containing protein [Bryobacterales bacterium]